jgi:hypothetical protein
VRRIFSRGSTQINADPSKEEQEEIGRKKAQSAQKKTKTEV